MHCAHKEWDERCCGAPQSRSWIDLPRGGTGSASGKHPSGPSTWEYQPRVHAWWTHLSGDGSGYWTCSEMGCSIRPTTRPWIYHGTGIIPQSPGRRGNGHETQRCLGQHYNASGTMVIPHVPHVHPFANWSLDSWRGMEHVDSVQVPECWVINRVCQRNKVRRQHCHTGNHCWMLGAPVFCVPRETGDRFLPANKHGVPERTLAPLYK